MTDTSVYIIIPQKFHEDIIFVITVTIYGCLNLCYAMQHSNYATYYYNTASRKTTWREMSLLRLYKILQPRQIVPVCTLFNSPHNTGHLITGHLTTNSINTPVETTSPALPLPSTAHPTPCHQHFPTPIKLISAVWHSLLLPWQTNTDKVTPGTGPQAVCLNKRNPTFK